MAGALARKFVAEPARARRPRREQGRAHALCHLCCEPLTDEDGTHYGYQCHRCAMHEHDLLVALAADPDHPEAAWLDRSPVEIAPYPRRDRR